MIFLCAILLAAPPAGARSAALLVPSDARAALLLDGAEATAGLKALLQAASAHAEALSPEMVGHRLADAVGPDLVTAPQSFGLSVTGPRALVFAGGAVGLTAPVSNARAARSALAAWLLGSAAPRKRSRGPTSGPERAGLVARVGGTLRLLTASGPGARALVTKLARMNQSARSAGRHEGFAAALRYARGKAALVFALSPPAEGAVLDLDASATGLVAKGLIAAKEPLLAGDAPDPAACADAALLCARAALGPGGRALLAQVGRELTFAALPEAASTRLEQLALRAVSGAERIVLRSDGVDLALLGDGTESAWAPRFAAVFAVPGFSAQPLPQSAGPGFTLDSAGLFIEGRRSLCLRFAPGVAWLASPCLGTPPADPKPQSGGPPLYAQIDTTALERVLARLTPIDALRGRVAAGAYASRLLFGALLRNAGPLQLAGRPVASGTEVTLRVPLR